MIFNNLIMNEIEQTNKIKILEELQINGRASASEIADKLGLSKQTVAKIISNMEKKKEIWGYTTIFNSKLVGKKPFILLIKTDLYKSNKDFLNKVTSLDVIKNNEELHGFNTTIFLHGLYDIMIILWAKDIIQAKKLVNSYHQFYKEYIKEIHLYDVLATIRNNRIVNPNMMEELTNLLI